MRDWPENGGRGGGGVKTMNIKYKLCLVNVSKTKTPIVNFNATYHFVNILLPTSTSFGSHSSAFMNSEESQNVLSWVMILISHE